MRGIGGKVAIVTGGASGIGEGIVRRFIEAGARVVISDVNQARGRILAEELGGDALSQCHDVASESDWERVVQETVARFGALNIVVNNAGIPPSGNIETLSFEEWRRQFSVHSDGAFLGCKYAFPEMLKSEYGRIVNISSSGAVVGYSSVLAYAAAKSSQLALTRSIAAHCRENGYPITCNAVLPGGILTPMTEEARRGGPPIDQAGLEAYKSRIGRPDDIAGMVLFLSSEDGSYVSGQCILVDGAMTFSVNPYHDDRLGPGFDFVQR